MRCENEEVLPPRDAELVQIVDASLADATRRGGAWLACKPGCTPCCHGVFRISQLDAARLRQGLGLVRAESPERAGRIAARARAAVARLRAHFPGDPGTGLLHPDIPGPAGSILDEAAHDELVASDLAEGAADASPWDTFADLPEADEACPVLDPATGRCELYSARPLTCRIFGPPVQGENGIGVCELCYTGANEEHVLRGEMYLQHHALESELDAELAAAGLHGETVIAWALAEQGPG